MAGQGCRSRRGFPFSAIVTAAQAVTYGEGAVLVRSVPPLKHRCDAPAAVVAGKTPGVSGHDAIGGNGSRLWLLEPVPPMRVRGLFCCHFVPFA
jgi:hypothetical protein